MIRYVSIIVLILTTVSCGLRKNKSLRRVAICPSFLIAEEDWIESDITTYKVQPSETLTDSLVTIHGFIFGKVKINDTIQVDTIAFATIGYKSTDEEEYNRGTFADLEGKYIINTTPGIYDFKLSFVGYNPLEINDVIIEKGTRVKLDATLGSGQGKEVFYMDSKDKMIYKAEE